jgi:hypothetical protein
MNDGRFGQLFTDTDMNIDPTSAQYKKDKVKAILNAKKQKRQQGN